jgi:3-hydroxybutyryl-CoA dehydrogenase
VPYDPVLPRVSPAVRSDQARLTAVPGVVGVVGAGTMGAGIAQLAIEAGHHVLLHDVDAGAIERGRTRIRSGLERRAARLELDPDSADDWVAGRLALLSDASTLELAAEGSELVVEAALEDLGAKRAIFRTLDRVAPETTLLATNTSALSVTEIASATRRQGRVLGLHFFNPAPIMPLVEVVAAPTTAEATLERATEVVTAWGKVPVRCGDAPGFIVNRVNRPFTLEALAILASGAGTIDGIDAAIRGMGYPMGPFELMDLIGIDVNLAAALGVFERTRGDGDPLAARFRPSSIQERLVAEGRLGRKTGGGFYAYGPDGRPAGAASDLGRDIVGGEPLADDLIVERIELAVVNEAYRALGEGVATVLDIDLAMRLGAGHPAGPFERVEVLGGTQALLDALRRHAADGPRFEPAPMLLGG